MKKNPDNNQSEIILYQAPNNQTILEVRFEGETIWLTQAQIVTLFSTSKANVSEHIKQIYQSKELEVEATVRKFRTVQIEGNRSVNRSTDHYNLDMIISENTFGARPKIRLIDKNKLAAQGRHFL